MDVGGPNKKTFNWWKLGFFLALFAFEFVREMFVFNTIPKHPQILTMPSKPKIYSGAGYSQAFTDGEWSKSSDDSDFDKLFKTFSNIECMRETGECTEQNVIVITNEAGYVSLSLESDSYKIDSFTDREVVYSGSSECYTYKVSINVALETTTAIKERTPLNTLPQCASTPARRVYTMSYENALPKILTIKDTEAFLPIFRTINYLVDLFD